MSENPYSVLTVFNKSGKLPKDDDVNRIKALSRSLFIVGERTIRSKDFEKQVRKGLPNSRIASVATKIGLSRFRRTIGNDEWSIEMFGSTMRHAGDKTT